MATAAARPLVTVQPYDEAGAPQQAALPAVFLAPIRSDVVKFVHAMVSMNKRQPYAVSTKAGHQTSAESWGTGRAVSRIPRVPGGGTHRAGQGAFGNMCRGGHLFAPLRIWRRWHRKVPIKMRRHAVASAIAASAVPALVQAHGHAVSKAPELPLVVGNEIEAVEKTSSALKALKRIGAYDDVAKVISSKKIRPGKGKMRNRRYLSKKGPLIVYGTDGAKLTKAFRNIPGVQVVAVEKLSVLDLAPGGRVGRFVIWTQSAFDKLEGLFGSFSQAPTMKRDFLLPRAAIVNSDITRIINSDEVQSVCRPKRVAPKPLHRLKRNPLKNRTAMAVLNPFAAEKRKQAAEAAAQPKAKKARETEEAKKAGESCPSHRELRVVRSTRFLQRMAALTRLSGGSIAANLLQGRSQRDRRSLSANRDPSSLSLTGGAAHARISRRTRLRVPFFLTTRPAAASAAASAAAAAAPVNESVTMEGVTMRVPPPPHPTCDVMMAVKAALDEDAGDLGDVTSLATIPAGTQASAQFLAKEGGVLAGTALATAVFRLLEPSIQVEWSKEDGDTVEKGEVFATVHGSAHAILQGERVALNFMQRMSGIATSTRAMVEAARPATVLETRKTAPGLRITDKWAVLIGGGQNHRVGLYDMLLVKDNHIAAAGGVPAAISSAREYIRSNGLDLPVEVEARTLDELQEVLRCRGEGVGRVTRVMLDNMVVLQPGGGDGGGAVHVDVSMLQQAVNMVNGQLETEASGNVTLETVGAIAATGVDFISSGALTHSVKALDISLNIDTELALDVGPKEALARCLSKPIQHESLDYEVLESAIHDEDWRSRTRVEHLQYTLLKWLFVLLVGAATGAVAFFINMGVENIAGFKYQMVRKYMKTESLLAGFFILVCSDVSLVLFSSLLCNVISMEAAGSGIPDVKAYLNGVDAPRIFAAKTLFVKIFGSIGSIAGGLAVGKEGPLVHTGACIANVLGQGGSRKYHLTWKWLRYFKNDRDRRDLVTCGAAAGVAGAFRAPVGGVLFALEEATSWWRSALLWRVFFTNAVVAMVVRALMTYCANGHCGLYNGGGFIIFDHTEAKTEFGVVEMFPVIGLGIIGGIAGSIFNQLNLSLCKLRQQGSRRGVWKIVEACAVAALTSAVRFSVPFLVRCQQCPDGIECPSKTEMGYYKSFTCPPGHYNDMAGLLFTPNDDSIRSLLSSGTHHAFSFTSLGIYFCCFYFLSILTYGITVPSGLFVPAIVCGATYGRVVGRIMSNYAPADNLDEGTYALIGTASFLGGSMRTTVSLCVILLELTGSLKLLPLIMIVLLVSKTVGDMFNSGIYDAHNQLKGIPYLEAHPEEAMRHYTAKDILVSEPVKFSGVESVERIYDTLRTTNHNSFPVIDTHEDGSTSFYGLVLRGHLLVLLRSKQSFLLHPQVSETVQKHLAAEDFGKPGSGKGLKLEDIQLSEEEQKMFLDLHPLANRSPYIVPESMSLNKAYMLFRQLGLRHLCVVPKPTHVLGIITRKDLLPQNFTPPSFSRPSTQPDPSQHLNATCMPLNSHTPVS
ncbi:unnamed protein product [Closterium sp. NIES-64]|nr:unnamed protein product [Closterium sp. NIES-64]